MFTLSSPAFEERGLIPVECAYTGVEGGKNISIPYEWRGAPVQTRSFVLLLVDRHPVANSWVHWLVGQIPAETVSLPRGASGRAMPGGSREHINSYGFSGYGGPQPPPGTGKHEYEAILYAVDTDKLDLPEKMTLDALTRALDGHVLGTASYSGLFGR